MPSPRSRTLTGIAHAAGRTPRLSFPPTLSPCCDPPSAPRAARPRAARPSSIRVRSSSPSASAFGLLRHRFDGSSPATARGRRGSSDSSPDRLGLDLARSLSRRTSSSSARSIFFFRDQMARLYAPLSSSNLVFLNCVAAVPWSGGLTLSINEWIEPHSRFRRVPIATTEFFVRFRFHCVIVFGVLLLSAPMAADDPGSFARPPSASMAGRRFEGLIGGCCSTTRTWYWRAKNGQGWVDMGISVTHAEMSVLGFKKLRWCRASKPETVRRTWRPALMAAAAAEPDFAAAGLVAGSHHPEPVVKPCPRTDGAAPGLGHRNARIPTMIASGPRIREPLAESIGRSATSRFKPKTETE